MKITPPRLPPIYLEHNQAGDEWTIVVDDGMGGTMSAVLDNGIVAKLRRTAQGPSVPMDMTTVDMVRLARNHDRAEPPRADPDLHPGTSLESFAREWEDWARQAAAWRLLIGARLARTALED